MKASLYTRPNKPRAVTRPELAPIPDFDTVTGPALLVVSAGTDCFVTPPDVADRMAEYANLYPECVVFEPHSGTGNLVRAIQAAEPEACIMANELNSTLYTHLCSTFEQSEYLNISQGDCMRYTAARFDRIVMNPPYSKRQALKHLQHAMTLLNPGGVIIALVPVTVGVPGAYEIERLPVDTFAGIKVNTKIIEVTK